MRTVTNGGHLDKADTSLVTAALRELTEETGIPAETVNPLRSLSGIPIDINIHPIPANPVKDEPPHHHFDFRFAFLLSAEHPIRLQPEEVTDYR
jgi:8-oxo-dGTP pyrophosphatase MutT (NUDIX family)